MSNLRAFPGFPSSVTPVRTAELFAEFDGRRKGVLLYPSTLDASLRTMLLVLSYSVVASAFIPPDESTVDYLRGCPRNGPPWGVFTL